MGRFAFATRPSSRWSCSPPWRWTSSGGIDLSVQRRELAAPPPDRRRGAPLRGARPGALRPGLATRSYAVRSDYLWTAAPWAAERPADVRGFGSNYELVDSAVQFQPWLEYTRDRLPDVPLWNTSVATGRPFLA